MNTSFTCDAILTRSSHFTYGSPPQAHTFADDQQFALNHATMDLYYVLCLVSFYVLTGHDAFLIRKTLGLGGLNLKPSFCIKTLPWHKRILK